MATYIIISDNNQYFGIYAAEDEQELFSLIDVEIDPYKVKYAETSCVGLLFTIDKRCSGIELNDSNDNQYLDDVIYSPHEWKRFNLPDNE